MKREEAVKFVRNIIVFSAPALAVFFYQLSQGVEFGTAFTVAMLALYGIIADFFKKIRK